jgi:hypothetical protein
VLPEQGRKLTAMRDPERKQRLHLADAAPRSSPSGPGASDTGPRGTTGRASRSLRTSGSRDAATRLRPVVGDQAAAFEHANPVAEGERLAHIVCDDHNALPHALLDPAKLRCAAQRA